MTNVCKAIVPDGLTPKVTIPESIPPSFDDEYGQEWELLNGIALIERNLIDDGDQTNEVRWRAKWVLWSPISATYYHELMPAEVARAIPGIDRLLHRDGKPVKWGG